MTSKATIGARLPIRRGFRAEEAAVYLGIGPSHFRKLVEKGQFPRPRLLNGIRVWDIDDLDQKFKALPYEGETDTWADVGRI